MDFSFGADAEMVRSTVHEFVRRELLPQEPKFLNAREPAERLEIIRAATHALKELGIYSAGVPEKFGGGGLGPIETCLIAEELSQTLIPVDWGEPTPILYECSDAQKPQYLLPVVHGDKRYALAFLEPEHFAEPAGMQTTAEPTATDYLLNGTKQLSRPDFDFCLVFARTPEGISCFILDKDAPGSTVRTRQGAAQDRALLVLDNCPVLKERLLGEPGGAMSLGRDWFGLSRLIRSAAILGVCQRLVAVTAQYAKDWTSMGEHISERPAVQRTVAEMAGDIEALRWLVYHTAWLAAEGKNVNFDSLLTKLQAQRVLQKAVTDSVRVHGGTIPPAEHWLVRASQEGEALDMLRLAVCQQVIAAYTS